MWKVHRLARRQEWLNEHVCEVTDTCPSWGKNNCGNSNRCTQKNLSLTEECYRYTFGCASVFCYVSFLPFLRHGGIEDLFQLHARSIPPSLLHQPLLEGVFLESAQNSCLSSPCTYQSWALFSLTFLFSEFTAFPPFGHLAIQKALKKSVPDTELPDRASLAGSVQIVFGAWCEAGVRCKE